MFAIERFSYIPLLKFEIKETQPLRELPEHLMTLRAGIMGYKHSLADPIQEFRNFWLTYKKPCRAHLKLLERLISAKIPKEEDV